MVLGLTASLGTEYGKIFFDMPTLLMDNIVGIVVVSTLLGPIWGIAMVIISNIVFNSFGIGQEFTIIIFIIKILEVIIVGIINYKKDKKISRFIVTILVLSLIIPFIGIIASTYNYRYANEIYNFREHIKMSMDMYGQFLKVDYLNNLKTYTISFLISMPIIRVFNKKLQF